MRYEKSKIKKKTHNINIQKSYFNRIQTETIDFRVATLHKKN